MAKHYSLLPLLFCFTAMLAQKPAEIGLVSDNDLYSSLVNDQYYTNGLELYYRYLGTRNNDVVAKRITEFRIGQYMYNPQSVKVADIRFHDRPFAGYLFAEAGLNTFYVNESVLKMSFQAGVLGPESGAEEVQEQLHKLFHYPKVEGWQHQITTALGLQAKLFYSHKIFPETFKEKTDFHLQAKLNAGTIWTDVSAGVTARISLRGALLPVYKSSLYGAVLSRNPSDKELREFYLYFSPNINYQDYDATIQGSRFNDTSPVTFPLIPFRFNAEGGVKYRKNNWILSYSVHYRSKELTNRVITGYYYGSIAVGYLL
ncbi:lipid A deacylase LpxR family protein [Flavobacterium sp. MK4S-17]|uniref:lipid A deacylase LpxR family protein n=1 Tax=Flavobacterium sp. MK4S-17 TaxID=2543737 RepID=UPI00135B9375|nr:lipid A deacylase LpxR family protein [Flavobacterium sp. MK4S-17]